MSAFPESDPSQPLLVGTPAPDFNLPASGGATIQLGDYHGQNLILVFYPRDQTPGCTRQLCALRDDKALFDGLNTAVLGSNPGSLESHDRFVAAQSYPFPILVDADRTMAKDYHALKEDGKGIVRTVYIIDGAGIIRYAQQGLPPDTELMEAIRSFPAAQYLQ
jgi:thioredoxin-dependent peroxiredoxin